MSSGHNTPSAGDDHPLGDVFEFGQLRAAARERSSTCLRELRGLLGNDSAFSVPPPQGSLWAPMSNNFVIGLAGRDFGVNVLFPAHPSRWSPAGTPRPYALLSLENPPPALAKKLGYADGAVTFGSPEAIAAELRKIAAT